jgi:hypothetical protein
MAVTINASTSAGLVQTADTSGVLQLQTANTTAVTVDTSQNVGIGVTPSAWVSGDTVIQVKAGSGTGSFWGRSGSMRTITNGYYDGTDYRYTASSLGVSIYECLSGTHTWLSAASGTAGNTFTPTERMRIDSSGNVLVNTTTSNAKLTVHATSGAAPLYLRVFTNADAGIFFANASGSIQGNITVNSASVTYNSTSDYRLKENIAPMTGALDKVAQLKPVTYTWKQDGSEGQGFIAHELAEVIPDAVTGKKDAVDAEGNPAYQSVDPRMIVATLTAAIQEQQTIINDLKARVTALEAK